MRLRCQRYEGWSDNARDLSCSRAIEVQATIGGRLRCAARGCPVVARNGRIGTARRCPLIGPNRNWAAGRQTGALDPGCVEKLKDDENNFPKSIATDQAHEASTTRNDTWRNAHSTSSQRRCVFTQPRPEADIYLS